MSTEVSVTIHGCRGSYPVTGEEHTRYGGATSCISVRVGEREIIFDAGSGIIDYGQRILGEALANDQSVTTTIMFSHSHFDHLIGLPYFPPIFHPETTLYLYGSRSNRFQNFEATIEHLIQSPYFPVSLHEMHALKFFDDIGEAEVIYFVDNREAPLKLRPQHPNHRARIPDDDDVDIKVECMRGLNHPKSGVNIYKIEAAGRTIVYATDTEGYVHGDQRLAEYARGADLLIHDAMYTEEHYTSMPVPTQGYGHSTVQIAAKLASLAEVDQLCLFHHDPSSTDDLLDDVGERSRQQFANTVVAQDGMVIEL